MTAPTIQTGLRAAGLNDLVTLLQDHHARRVDIVAPAEKITALASGQLMIDQVEPVVSADGVTMADGLYLPTHLAQGQIGDALGIPAQYLRKLAGAYPELWADNINAWLAHEQYRDRKYLVRGLRGDLDEGVARAFLSDRYRLIDNLDVLMAALDGIREAGVQVDITTADLTDSRMYVRVRAPQVAVAAERLLAGYRSPFEFGIQRAGDARPMTSAGPLVFAGFVLSNSEVGAGAFTIAPQVVVQICGNGMTITKESIRRTHLGEKLDAGVIQWSEATQDKLLELVKSQTTDAVRTFLSPEWLGAKVAELEAIAGTPVTDPPAVIETVSKRLSYDKQRQADLLRHFTLGGQMTAGGVAQAVTSVAQTLESADAQYDMEADAIVAMELAAATS